VGFGLICDRRIETFEPQHHVRLSDAFSQNMRTAFGAETPEFPRRRLIAGQQLLTPGPSEFVAGNGRDGGEGGGVRLSASLTMAMDDRSGGGIDLVGNAAAHTASGKQSELLADNDAPDQDRRFCLHNKVTSGLRWERVAGFGQRLCRGKWSRSRCHPGSSPWHRSGKCQWVRRGKSRTWPHQ
jgi:hypothetical protein